MGCDEPISAERVKRGEVHTIGGLELDRCPMALLQSDFAQAMVDAYGWWKSGQLGLVVERPSARCRKAIASIDRAVKAQQRTVEG